jgi:hypothetical protein
VELLRFLVRTSHPARESRLAYHDLVFHTTGWISNSASEYAPFVIGSMLLPHRYSVRGPLRLQIRRTEHRIELLPKPEGVPSVSTLHPWSPTCCFTSGKFKMRTRTSLSFNGWPSDLIITSTGFREFLPWSLVTVFISFTVSVCGFLRP